MLDFAMDATSSFIVPVSGLLGLIFGSFIGMSSYRWPQNQSWLPSSACPSCGGRLRARWLVPVLSWVWLKGVSGCCQKKISPRYPAIEATTALLFMACALVATSIPQLVLLAGLTGILVFLSVVDLETGYIPDGSNILIALLGGVWLCLHPPASWLEPCLSVLQTGAVAIFLAWGYSRLRGRDMMGWGDVKLMIPSGLWLAPELAPAYLAVAGFLGVLFGWIWTKQRGEAEFPFGPALAVSLWVFVVFQISRH
jgi:leader peptidase (prepilin peptidase)/N-methyltransferase